MGKRLTAADFTLTGGFLLPSGYNNGARFAYGDRAIACDPVNNHLFITTHRTETYTAVGSGIQTMKWGKTGIVESRFTSLLTAPLVQNNFDPTIVGGVSTWNQATGGSNRMWGGGFVYDGFFYPAVTNWYDASGTSGTRGTPNLPARWKCNLDLSSAGHLGPYVIECPPQDSSFANNYPNTAWYDGWGVEVPDEYKAALGWNALVGNGTMSTVGRHSYGISLMGHNPEDLGGGVYAGTAADPIPSELLAGYNRTHPWNEADRAATDPTLWTSEVWNGTGQICGVVWPPGSDTLVFAGRQGMGTIVYAGGGYSPAGGFRTQLWLVDVARLLEVKAGTRKPYEVYPYEIVPLTLMSDNGEIPRGVTLHTGTQTMFYRAQTNESTVLHTIVVDVDPPPPPTPSVGKPAMYYFRGGR